MQKRWRLTVRAVTATTLPNLQDKASFPNRESSVAYCPESERHTCTASTVLTEVEQNIQSTRQLVLERRASDDEVR